MKRLWLLTAVGLISLASARAEDAAPGTRLLGTLTKGVPAADLFPRTPEVETEASRIAHLLDDAGEKACRASCDDAGPALETLCTGLIRPEAARSEAVCYARISELVGACRARCPE